MYIRSTSYPFFSGFWGENYSVLKHVLLKPPCHGKGYGAPRGTGLVYFKISQYSDHLVFHRLLRFLACCQTCQNFQLRSTSRTPYIICINYCIHFRSMGVLVRHYISTCMYGVHTGYFTSNLLKIEPQRINCSSRHTSTLSVPRTQLHFTSLQPIKQLTSETKKHIFHQYSTVHDTRSSSIYHYKIYDTHVQCDKYKSKRAN